VTEHCIRDFSEACWESQDLGLKVLKFLVLGTLNPVVLLTLSNSAAPVLKQHSVLQNICNLN